MLGGVMPQCAGQNTLSHFIGDKHAMRSRLWLLAPAAILCAGDVVLTLLGQPSTYWAGAYSSALEINPVVHPFLRLGPWVFVGAATVWLAILSLPMVVWRHPVVGWAAVLFAACHAVGGASWLARSHPWGLVLGCVYLFAAARASSWCWNRRAKAPKAVVCLVIQ